MNEVRETPEDLIKGLSPEVSALIRYVNEIADGIDADPSLTERRDILSETLTRLNEAVAAGQITPEYKDYLLAAFITQNEAESNLDSLTKIYNRKGLERRFGEEVARFKRESYQGKKPPPPLSVCLMDIDNFKEFNDRNGHPAGDKLLIDIAAALRLTLRGVDITGRIGGDEFVVILPGIKGKNAIFAMDRVVRKMRVMKLPVTCSFGIAQIDNEYRWEELYPRADVALDRTKKTGERGRAVLWQNGMPEKVERPQKNG